MKKTILFLISILSLTACVGDDSGNTPYGGSEYLDAEIRLSDQKTAILTINASENCLWVITWSDSGIQNVSPTTGQGSREVTINLEENPSFKSERTISLLLANSSGTIQRPMTVTQSKGTEYIKLNPTSLPTFSNAGGFQDIAISSNTTWDISTSKEWVRCSVDSGENNGSVRITVDKNTTKEEREAEVLFKGEGVTEKLTILQDGDAYTTFSSLLISDVTKNSAVVKFSFDSGSTVTSYGVCYAKTDSPDLSNAIDIVLETGEARHGTPSFTITGLETGTVYYVRAYVTNTTGTQYSESKSFTTASGMPGGNDNVTPNI